MTPDQWLISERFPRSSQYHPDWILASASGGVGRRQDRVTLADHVVSVPEQYTKQPLLRSPA